MQNLLSDTIKHFIDHSHSIFQNRKHTYEDIYRAINKVYPKNNVNREIVTLLINYDFYRVIELYAVGQNFSAYVELHNVMHNLLNRIRLDMDINAYRYAEGKLASISQLAEIFRDKELITDVDLEFLENLACNHNAVLRRDSDSLVNIMNTGWDYEFLFETIGMDDSALIHHLVASITICVNLLENKDVCKSIHSFFTLGGLR